MNWQGFLFSWTPEKAWWWGTMLGDGCVYSNPNTGDYRAYMVGSESTVRNWLNLLRPDRAPQKMKRANAYQGYIGCKPMVEWLCLNGMGPRKTHSLQWPLDLPDDLLPHFLRGLWDTDGSLTISRRKVGNPDLVARYGSACQPFVRRLQGILTLKVGLADTAVVANRKGDNEWWTIKQTGPNALKLAKYLYEDAPEHLRNEDRMVRYREMTALNEEIASATCSCGKPATREGLCQPCWWDRKGRRTGETALCSCGKKVLAKGMCAACYSRKRRGDYGQMRVTNL